MIVVYIPLTHRNFFEEDSNLKRFKIFEVFEIEFESTAHLEEQCSSDD